jgi:hypothetical protein
LLIELWNYDNFTLHLQAGQPVCVKSKDKLSVDFSKCRRPKDKNAYEAKHRQNMR